MRNTGYRTNTIIGLIKFFGEIRSYGGKKIVNIIGYLFWSNRYVIFIMEGDFGTVSLLIKEVSDLGSKLPGVVTRFMKLV